MSWSSVVVLWYLFILHFIKESCFTMRDQTFFWSTFFSPFKWQHGLIFSTLLLYGTWFYSSKKQLLDYFSWNSSIWLILIWLVILLCLSQIRHSSQMSHLLWIAVKIMSAIFSWSETLITNYTCNDGTCYTCVDSCICCSEVDHLLWCHGYGRESIWICGTSRSKIADKNFPKWDKSC
mgnify:CR=1 FL=1